MTPHKIMPNSEAEDSLREASREVVLTLDNMRRRPQMWASTPWEWWILARPLLRVGARLHGTRRPRYPADQDREFAMPEGVKPDSADFGPVLSSVGLIIGVWAMSDKHDELPA